MPGPVVDLVEAEGLTAVMALSAHWVRDGSVRCWGIIDSGQLGMAR